MSISIMVLVGVLFAHFQKLQHRIAGPCKQGVEHRDSGQGLVDLALGLGFFDPAAQSVAHFHQAVHVVLAGHQGSAQAGILAGQ
jgi:hypothetical protein